MSASRRIAVWVVLGALMAACSSTSHPSSTVPPPTTTRTTAPNGVLPAIQDQLLTPSDVGPAFVLGTYTPRTGPQPCGQPDVDAQLPPAARAGAEIDGTGATEVVVTEVIERYRDVATARRAFAAKVAGVTCASGTAGSGANQVTLHFQAPADVTKKVGGDQATEVRYTSIGLGGELMAVRTGPELVELTLAVAAGSSSATTPDLTTLAGRALQKI